MNTKKIIFLSVCAFMLCIIAMCYKDKITNPQVGTLVLNIHFPPNPTFFSAVDVANEWQVTDDSQLKKAVHNTITDNDRELGQQQNLQKPSITFSSVTAIIYIKDKKEPLSLKREANNRFVYKKDFPAGKIDSIRVSAYAQDATLVAQKDTLNIMIAADQVKPLDLTLEFVAGVERTLSVDPIDHRHVPVNYSSPPPLIAHVLDAFENGVMGRHVRFFIESGDASFTSNGNAIVLKTDDNGEATAYWRVGGNPGKICFLISATDRSDSTLKGSPTALEFTSHPRSTPDSLALCPSMAWYGNICDSLNAPICIKIFNPAGDGVELVPVNFTILSNNAVFPNGRATIGSTTNSDGKALTQLILGSSPGEVRIRVDALDGSNQHIASSPLIFDIGINVDGIADSLVYISGDNQTAFANDTLPEPIIIRIVDYFGKSVSDWPVNWEIVSGDAAFLNIRRTLTTRTDTQGRAGANVRVGTAGPVSININCRNKCGAVSNSPMPISVTVIPNQVDSLRIIRGPGLQGSACDSLSEQIVVQRVDAQGQGIAEKEIFMQILSDSAVFFNQEKTESLITNKDGNIYTNILLGFVHAPIVVRARSFEQHGEDISGSPNTFSVTSDASGIIATLNVISGNEQSGYPGDTLAIPLVVQALDLPQNPVVDKTILFSVISGNARLSNGDDQMDTVTDINGRAETQLILGESQGDVVVEAFINNECSMKIVAAFSETILPLPAPVISAIYPVIAVPEDTVTISGKNFNFGLTAVRFGADLQPSPSFRVLGDTLIFAVVPYDANSGPVEVETIVGRSNASPPFYALSLHGELALPSPIDQLVDMRADNVGKKLYIANTAAVIFQLEHLQSPITRTIVLADTTIDIATFDLATTGPDYDEILVYSNRFHAVARIRSDNGAVTRMQSMDSSGTVHKIYSMHNGDSFILLSATQLQHYNYDYDSIEQEYSRAAQFTASVPFAAAFSKDDMIYVTLNGSEVLQYYGRHGAGQPITFDGEINDGLRLYDIILDSQEQYGYFTSIKDRRINKFDLATKNATNFQPNFVPRCMSIGQNDRFLLVGNNSGRVYIIDLLDHNRIVYQFNVAGSPDMIEFIDLPEGRYFYSLSKTSSRISQFVIKN